MAHVSVVIPVTRRLALSEEVIATFAKPPTKWHKLAVASNEQVFEKYRTIGNIFFLVAGIAATGLIISLTYRKTNLLKVSGLLSIGTAIAGLVFRYFGNTAPILKLRDEVRSNIEKFTLANIRLTYPDENVISNQELNEWARYFLHTQPFEKFLSIHWSSIFDFQLEDDTIKLIKQKYFYRIYHPDNPKNLVLSSEVLNSRLFEREERNAIKEFQASVREKFQIFSLSDACQKYITKTFSEIAPSQCAIYAWLFTIYIWNEKIGIEELRKKYADALKKFTPHFTDYSPERYIADREAAALNYDRFVDRNGEAAVHLISNFPHFLKLILQLNLGLIKTLEMFKDDIARFGAAAQVEQAVLMQEWSQLAHLTYAEVRERNGPNVILEVSDPEVKKQLKEKFLGLPPAELANNDKYKEEKKVLGFVDDREISLRLSQTWGEMSFRFILSLPPATMKLILEFSKKNGKNKATEEIKSLPIAEVLEVYQPLFQEGVLDFTDYDFTNRLESLTIVQFIPLMQRYGMFFLEKGLLKKTDLRLTQFVSAFVYEQRQAFLTQDDLSKDGVWKMVFEFEFIKENWSALRVSTLRQLSLGSDKHLEELKTLEAEHAAYLRNVPLRVQVQQRASEAASQQCRSKLRLAEQTLESKVNEREAFLQSCKQWELDVAEKERIHEQEKASFEQKKTKKAQLEAIPRRLVYLAAERQTEQESLRDLEDRLRRKNKTSAAVTTLDREIVAIEKEITALNTRKFELGDERDKVLGRLQTLESPPITRFGVQLRSTNRTHAELAPASETSADVSSTTNPTEIEEVKARFKAIEREIDAILTQVRECRAQIREKRQSIEKALEDFSQYSERKTLVEKIAEIAGDHKAKLDEQTALQEDCRDLESLQKKVELAEREIDQFPETRRNNMVKTREFERDIRELEGQRDAAKTASQQADTKITSVTSTLSATLISEENKSYNARVEEENRRFLMAIEGIKKKAETQLCDMLR